MLYPFDDFSRRSTGFPASKCDISGKRLDRNSALRDNRTL